MIIKRIFIILFYVDLVFGYFSFESKEIRLSRNFPKQDDLCEQQLNFIQENFDLRVLWARKMRDSWGNFPSGVFSGNYYDFGNFDQCINFRHYSYEVGEIKGQHCTLMLPYDRNEDSSVMAKFMLPSKQPEINVGIGICVPSSCDPNRVKEIADEELRIKYNVTTTSGYSQSFLCSKAPQPLEFNNLQIFAIFILGTVLMLMLFSTAYEIHCLTRNTKKNQILSSFSVYSNSKAIMTTKPMLNNEIIFLHGIRSILIIWIVFGHSLMMTYWRGPTMNSETILEHTENLFTMLILSGVMAVDTFFLLSAFLMTSSVLRELDRTNKINIPIFLLKRYIRITVPLAVMVLFTLTFFYHISDGPLWSIITKSAAIGLCEKNWWSTLLYIGNYVNPGKLCFGHSWYLMVDMQLYFLSPIILYPLWRLRNRIKIAVPLIFVIASSSVIFVFVMYLVKGFRVSYKFESNGVKDAMLYTVSHGRIDSWMMGVLVGFIMYSIQGKVVKLSKSAVTIGWIISIGMLCMVLFGQYPLQKENFHENSLIADAAYDALKRICWCLAVGWIIIACHLSYGGIVKRFLSLSIWLPISKLSFCIYLVHLPVQLVFLASSKSPQYFSGFLAMNKFLGDFGISLFAAFALALMFEFPTLHLLTVLVAKKK